MNPTADIAVQPGQVWEHRTECRMCKGKPHRHRYLVIKADPRLVIVRDLSVTGNMPTGSRYAMPTAAFGSLAKGGLRLAGHRVRQAFVPLAAGDLDDRVVEHQRIALTGVPRWRGPIPGTDGERLAA